MTLSDCDMQSERTATFRLLLLSTGTCRLVGSIEHLLSLSLQQYLCLQLLDLFVDVIPHLCLCSLLRVVFLWGLQTLFAESLDLHLLLADLLVAN